jgi:hypothetical protein
MTLIYFWRIFRRDLEDEAKYNYASGRREFPYRDKRRKS